jgi:hypothetical protein
LLAKKRLRRIPKAKRADVTRDEYNALVDRLNERARLIEDMQRTLEAHARRMTEMQAELDELREAANATPKRYRSLFHRP